MAKNTDPNAPKKVRKTPAPRKQFVLYKLGVDDSGQPKLDSISFTRNPMVLVDALQSGDGTKFMEVQLKK